MSRRIKVLFAIPSLDTGGPDRVMFELLSALDRNRFEPSLLVSQPGGKYLARLPADVPIKVLGNAPGLRDRYPVLRALRHVRETAPDIVFATLRMQLTLGLSARAFPRRTRLVLRPATPHSLDFAALIQRSIKHRISRRIALATLHQADAVVCQSEQIKTDLRDVLGDERKLHVIGNPIDMAAVTRAALATTAQLPGHPALVSVGRFAPVKGYDILLNALPAVRARFPGLHLTIFGDGPDRGSLEDLARRLDLERSVTFAGFNAEPLPAVRAAELFVLASRYEGFPNAALEALACGTPVVLTGYPGATGQLVQPGVNGRLATGVEPAELARALIVAISELPRYDRAGITAECGRRHGARQIVAAYEDVFSAVCGPPDQPERASRTRLDGHPL